jgi:hypothetical protein
MQRQWTRSYFVSQNILNIAGFKGRDPVSDRTKNVGFLKKKILSTFRQTNKIVNLNAQSE